MKINARTKLWLFMTVLRAAARQCARAIVLTHNCLSFYCHFCASASFYYTRCIISSGLSTTMLGHGEFRSGIFCRHRITSNFRGLVPLNSLSRSLSLFYFLVLRDYIAVNHCAVYKRPIVKVLEINFLPVGNYFHLPREHAASPHD
jgi:hypothetical protein